MWSIFPAHWHVPQLLCIMFCNITKTQLAEILDTRVRCFYFCFFLRVDILLTRTARSCQPACGFLQGRMPYCTLSGGCAGEI